MGDFLRSVNPRPINGRLLIRMLGNSTTTGGIIIPSTAMTRPMHGVVEEVSEGYYDEGVFRSHSAHIGDIVIFKSIDGFDLQLDDVDYRIIHEKDIVAILDDLVVA